MSKFLKILKIIVVVLCVLYLFFTLIVLPFGLKWVAESKGSELLRHPVRIGSVSFNPFLWKLSIQALRILDHDQSIMFGFNRLTVDVSFLDLIKKKYHVESIDLDGLQVNAILLADGHINLLDLVPAMTLPVAPTKSVAAKAVMPSSAPTALPLVFIDVIHVTNGQVHFTDQTVHPNFSTALTAIDVQMSNISTKSDAEVKTIVQAELDQRGTISSESLIKPFAQPLELDASFALNNYLLDIVTPYSGKYTGRGVKEGKLDFTMAYRISNNKLTASHKILIQKFGFGDKVESKDALNLPFGLVVGLLEDPQGRIKISLPVTGNMKDPKFHYMHLVGEVIRNFFMKLVTKPFSFLGSMLGMDEGTDDLGSVHFAPGAINLTDSEKQKLNLVLKALKERPKLLLRINGAYDPDLDWTEIKTRAFMKDYKYLTVQGRDTETWALHHLYQSRFGLRALWALTKAYKLPQGGYDLEKLNVEMKHQLIDKAPVEKTALDVLAQERAKTIDDFVIKSGFDPARVSIGVNQTTQGSVGQVPLELSLTTVN